MKTIIIGANSDLGVHIDGDSLGPAQLINDIKSFYNGEIIEFKTNENIIKSKNLSDRRKNEYELDIYNTNLFKNLVNKKTEDEDNFIILIGGDESVTIPSVLSTKEVKNEIGLIYFTGNSLFDTFETTQNGNLKDLTIPAICGYKTDELSYYTSNNVPISKTVIIGCRNLTDNQKDNLRYAGANYFSTDKIKEEGLNEIIEKAFEIASNKTKGVHIVFSLSFLDPKYAPAISTPVFDGFDETTISTINQKLKEHIDEIISYDLVGFNPLRDVERKTEQIAVNILAQIINLANKKNKLGKIERKY